MGLFFSEGTSCWAGCCIVVGYHAKIGAWLIVLFLVLVTVTMHNFRVVRDPTQA